MAVESVTVGTLVSRVSFRLTNMSTAPTSPVDLATEIKWALNETLRDLMNECPEHPAFLVEYTFSTSSQDNSLPDALIGLSGHSVRHNATPYTRLNYLPPLEVDRRAPALANTSTTGRPQLYTFLGRKTSDNTGDFVLRLYPSPDTSYSLILRYYAISTSISSASDGTELDRRFPRECVQALVYGACLHFPHYLSASQLAETQALYARALQRFQETAKPVKGVAYHSKVYGSSDTPGDPAWPGALSNPYLP